MNGHLCPRGLDAHDAPASWCYRRCGCRCDGCREVMAEVYRRYRHRRRAREAGNPQPRRVFPTAPLVARVEAAGGPAACCGEGIDGREALLRAYHRAACSDTVAWAAADRLAIELLGVHPVELWGDDWWTDQPTEVAA